LIHVNGSSDNITPGFLSLAFHTRFFPSLLKSRLLRPKERGRSGFSTGMDHTIALAVCVILVMLGLPGAIDEKSVIGWVLTALGAAGIIALLINSIVSNTEQSGYDNFLAGIFFFFVLFGMTAGVFTGTINHSLPQGILVGIGGTVGGYLFGILAGLSLQYLGWIAVMANGLAWLAVIGMVCVDLVLLSGVLI